MKDHYESVVERVWEAYQLSPHPKNPYLFSFIWIHSYVEDGALEQTASEREEITFFKKEDLLQIFVREVWFEYDCDIQDLISPPDYSVLRWCIKREHPFLRTLAIESYFPYSSS